MANRSSGKIGRWALAVVAVAVLASVTFAASGVHVVSAKPVANTAVVVLKNCGNEPVGGTLAVHALGSNGQLMHSAASFSVGAGSLASVVVVFDAPVASITTTPVGISDEGTPF